jgi:hypothetical protein
MVVSYMLKCEKQWKAFVVRMKIKHTKVITKTEKKAIISK